LRENHAGLREVHALAGGQGADSLGNGAGIGHAKENFMKSHCSERRNHGLTLVEVLVVIFVVGFFALMILPSDNHFAGRKAIRIDCVNKLKEISLACRIWEGDHGNKYPMDVSVTNGGTMELSEVGTDAWRNFLVMSNELTTPRILICPADQRNEATDFGPSFGNTNISYFINLDAAGANPQMPLFGDDNFEMGGVPVESGLLQISTNTPIAWSAVRHGRAGNVALTDGSVQQLTTSGLQQVFQNTGAATNRISIP
jgi:prepilin-type N-terminal cleavage/methylation domain-containing protein/prepilin-type processing-associated H-X9-DG protein